MEHLIARRRSPVANHQDSLHVNLACSLHGNPLDNHPLNHLLSPPGNHQYSLLGNPAVNRRGSLPVDPLFNPQRNPPVLRALRN